MMSDERRKRKGRERKTKEFQNFEPPKNQLLVQTTFVHSLIILYYTKKGYSLLLNKMLSFRKSPLKRLSNLSCFSTHGPAPGAAGAAPFPKQYLQDM